MKPGEIEKMKADNAKLKSENARLKKHIAKSDAGKKKARYGIIRKTSIVILVIIAVITLAVGNLALWFGNTIVKTDRFVAATAPIIKDPQVQKTMALYTTNSIFSNVDVLKITESVLPPRADFLAPQLTNQLKTFTQASVQKAFANPKFQDRWNAVNAKQHERLITFASKYQGDGDISLNEIFNQLAGSLSGTKLGFLADKRLPPNIGDISVVNASWLPAFHNVVVHIDTWRLMLIILLVVSLALATWLSANRRRTIFTFCIASAVLVTAMLIGLYILKSQIVGKVDPQYSQGVGQVIHIFSHSFVIQSVTVLAALLVAGLITWVSSTARSASNVRNNVTPMFSVSIHRQIFPSENSVTLWIHKRRHMLEWLVVALFTVIALLVRLTLLSLLIYATAMLALVLAIEALGGEGQAPPVKRGRTSVSGVTSPDKSRMV
jgi:hypothetical protein